MKIKTIKNLILLTSLASLPILALAYYGVQQPPVKRLYIEDILRILQTAINWIFSILLIVAVIFILLAAFSYLFSAGDPEKVKTAQSRLIYAAVAIGVGLIAEGIQFIVRQLVGA
jgi:hypothetical protein